MKGSRLGSCARAACGFAWLVLGACGEDEEPATFVLDGSVDASVMDATLDASISDAALEAARPDASAIPGTCTIEAESSFAFEESGERAWAALQHQDTVHVAFVARSCGERETLGTAIHYLTVRSTGALEPERVLTNDDQGVCLLAHTPALAPNAAGGVDLFYTSDERNGFELYQRSVEPDAGVQRLTEDPAGALDNELETVATAVSSGSLVAYSNRLLTSDVGGIVTRLAGQPELELLSPTLGHAPQDLVMVPLAGGNAAGVLGWVSKRAGARSISLQPFAATGAALGDRVELSSTIGAFSTLALASNAEHRAVVYTRASSANHELRYHQLDAEGRPTGEEKALTVPNRSAVNPALAPYANGYVVAFREVPSSSQTPPSLKLLFITRSGTDPNSERQLATAAPSGGDTRVFVANDGRLIVLWSDYTATGASLRIVRARCL